MSLKPEELTKLFASLSAEQQEEFSKIAMDFIAVAGDQDVVPMLLNVPKTALNSKHAMVRVPISKLTANAAEERRQSEGQRLREYRNNLPPEKAEEERQKAAERMRRLRAERKKAQSSDPSL